MLFLKCYLKFISNCILKLNFQSLITVFSYIEFLNLYNHLFWYSVVEFVVYRNLFLKQIVTLKVMWQWMFVCELSPRAWSQDEIGHSPPSSSTVKRVWNTCIFPTPSQPTRLQYQRKHQNRQNPSIIQQRVERWLQMQIIKHRGNFCPSDTYFWKLFQFLYIRVRVYKILVLLFSFVF